MTTSAPSQLSLFGGVLTSSAAARPASPRQSQGSVVARLTSDGSGASSCEWWTSAPPVGSWQRTLLGSLLSTVGERWPGSSITLERVGTRSRYSRLRLRISGQVTVAPGCGSWPTVRASSDRTSARSLTMDGHWSAPSLGQAVELSEGTLPREVSSLEEIKSPAGRAMWPTAHGMGRDGHRHAGPTGCELGRAVTRCWPTARAEDSESCGAHVERGTAETLTAAARMWPTPDVGEVTGGRSRRGQSKPGRESLKAAVLWPTATAGDSIGSGNRNLPGSKAHAGTSLTDAVNGGQAPRRASPLATPSARDWRSGKASQETLDRNSRPLNEQALAWETPQTRGRKSTKAMTSSTNNGRRSGGGNSSTPGLEQQAELAAGIVPSEMVGVPLAPAARAFMGLTQLSPEAGPPDPVSLSASGRQRGSWATPISHEGSNRRTKPTPAQLCGEAGMQLAAQVHMATPPYSEAGPPDPENNSTSGRSRGSWATPDTGSTGWRDAPGRQGGASLPAQVRGQLNPAWVSQLMGLPDGWLEGVPA
jgi:hypothetical protein